MIEAELSVFPTIVEVSKSKSPPAQESWLSHKDESSAGDLLVNLPWLEKANGLTTYFAGA